MLILLYLLKGNNMTTEEFKEYVKTRKALNTEEIHRLMDDMSNYQSNRRMKTPVGLLHRDNV